MRPFGALTLWRKTPRDRRSVGERLALLEQNDEGRSCPLRSVGTLEQQAQRRQYQTDTSGSGGREEGREGGREKERDAGKKEVRVGTSRENDNDIEEDADTDICDDSDSRDDIEGRTDEKDDKEHDNDRQNEDAHKITFECKFNNTAIYIHQHSHKKRNDVDDNAEYSENRGLGSQLLTSIITPHMNIKWSA